MGKISKGNNRAFGSIEKAVSDLKKGKLIIVVDDESRENEGDLICAGSLVDKEKINFMLKHGRGLICAPIAKKIAEQFSLDLMTKPKDPFQTGFTVSVDAKEGTTTGISASDRVKTISVLCDERKTADDLNKPGHLFPLLAKEGGVLQRAGHTEATVDLLKIAKMKPVGVICEVIMQNGEMARLNDLKRMAKKHKLALVSVADIIKYRLKKESLVEKVSEAKLPTEFGDFKVLAFKDKIANGEYLALVKGNIKKEKEVIVRVHSGCITGDIFHSLKCDCRKQLENAIRIVQKSNAGIILYLHQHEGRGIGIVNKIKAYNLQDKGLDTVEANKALGFSADLREYGIGAQILKELGVRKIKLLTNNPKKIVALNGYGIEIVKQIPLIVQSNKFNEKYLETKRTKLGHLL
ncbi:MAG: bifunctional 3,4-dihydroxy-2-butanone-4-phosphate synthase/GTP cyclohydrolase II [archaeon]